MGGRYILNVLPFSHLLSTFSVENGACVDILEHKLLEVHSRQLSI